jgi:transposase
MPVAADACSWVGGHAQALDSPRDGHPPEPPGNLLRPFVISRSPVRLRRVIAAELGCDMTRFPTAGHAASWTGLCTGNHESAGKRLSGRTRFANRTLRAALVESARGAIRKRDCYLAAQYRRLVKRRGDKKAIVAVAHSILVIAYHVLRDGVSYRELGGDYFERLNTDRLTRYHTKRLAALGYTVTLAKHAA